jgi:hypothetical protein
MQSNITIRPTRYGATWSVWRFALLFGILGLAPLPLHAGPPELSLPLDCKIGETCWLVNLVDRQPGPGRTDFRCGDLQVRFRLKSSRIFMDGGTSGKCQK